MSFIERVFDEEEKRQKCTMNQVSQQAPAQGLQECKTRPGLYRNKELLTWDRAQLVLGRAFQAYQSLSVHQLTDRFRDAGLRG